MTDLEVTYDKTPGGVTIYHSTIPLHKTGAKKGLDNEPRPVHDQRQVEERKGFDCVFDSPKLNLSVRAPWQNQEVEAACPRNEPSSTNRTL